MCISKFHLARLCLAFFHGLSYSTDILCSISDTVFSRADILCFVFYTLYFFEFILYFFEGVNVSKIYRANFLTTSAVNCLKHFRKDPPKLVRSYQKVFERVTHEKKQSINMYVKKYKLKYKNIHKI